MQLITCWPHGGLLGTLTVALYGSLCYALPSSLSDSNTHGYKSVQCAHAPLTGYLGAFFLGADPYVYFYLSNGNNATSLSALNQGQPVIRPTKGTKGVRDPAIVKGGGAEAGKKWYIVGTDLDIGSTTWDAAERNGSRGIFVWESTDLLNWTNERLVTVEDATAGMVWAPEAIWDPTKGQYLVHWASKFYSANDTEHTGSPTNIRIRYAYTTDFHSFSSPQTYINKSPTDIIDLTILSYPPSTPNSFLRFMKDETLKNVFVETSTTGLFGNWTRQGGANAVIEQSVEGPAAFVDNLDPGKVRLLLDFYEGDGYRPYESKFPGVNGQGNGGWTASGTGGWPSGLRHGSVLPIRQAVVDALKKKWG